MDGERFDYLARRLAGPLPRRRLLRRAAGGLVGAVLASRASRAQAQGDTCPPDCVCIPDLGGTIHCCPPRVKAVPSCREQLPLLPHEL